MALPAGTSSADGQPAAQAAESYRMPAVSQPVIGIMQWIMVRISPVAEGIAVVEMPNRMVLLLAIIVEYG